MSRARGHACAALLWFMSRAAFCNPWWDWNLRKLLTIKASLSSLLFRAATTLRCSACLPSRWTHLGYSQGLCMQICLFFLFVCFLSLSLAPSYLWQRCHQPSVYSFPEAALGLSLPVLNVFLLSLSWSNSQTVQELWFRTDFFRFLTVLWSVQCPEVCFPALFCMSDNCQSSDFYRFFPPVSKNRVQFVLKLIFS